ncbi:MAG: hypothetical protein ACXVBQ_15130 [Pseudobdellovibrionaceae bacterium]
MVSRNGPIETAIYGPYGTSKPAKVVPLETGASISIARIFTESSLRTAIPV